MVIAVRSGLYLILLLSAIISCKTENHRSSSSNEAVELVMPVAAEEDLIVRCFPWFFDRPIDSAQIQHNELVNLIIDRGWDFHVTPSGTFYHIVHSGSGPSVGWGDQVSVHYTGYDLTLQPFHSTRKGNAPFRFYIGNVIQGWNEGLPLIKEGGRLLLLVPSYKAYGAEGFGDLVASNQHLLFDIELVQKL